MQDHPLTPIDDCDDYKHEQAEALHQRPANMAPNSYNVEPLLGFSQVAQNALNKLKRCEDSDSNIITLLHIHRELSEEAMAICEDSSPRNCLGPF